MEFCPCGLSSPRIQAWIGLEAGVERWSVGALERSECACTLTVFRAPAPELPATPAPIAKLSFPSLNDNFMDVVLPADHSADTALVVVQGVLAQGFRPEAVAVTILTLTRKPDVAAAGDFFLDAAQIRTQLNVSG